MGSITWCTKYTDFCVLVSFNKLDWSPKDFLLWKWKHVLIIDRRKRDTNRCATLIVKTKIKTNVKSEKEHV